MAFITHPFKNQTKSEMSSIGAMWQENWGSRHLIPNGVRLMLFAYSLVAFGSPMPPKITWVEIVIGCGLLMGGIALASSVIREIQQQKMVKWCLGLTASLFFIPLYIGLVRGNALSDIARDIFPLAFLLMVPILLKYSASSANRAALRTLMATALAFVGICTAITFFVGALNLVGSTDQMVSMMREGFGQVMPSQISLAGLEEEVRIVFLKLYDPAMLFVAIFLSSWGAILMVKSWRECVPGMIFAAMGALIAYGFMILGLRAYAAFFVLAVLTVSLTKWRDRGLYVRLLPFILAGCVLFWSQIGAVLQLLWIKQEAVGTNGKADEWLAVINLVFSSPKTTLLGIGWGGMFSNPILNETTRFTHSALSFYLLKSGVLGLITLLSIIVILLFQGRRFGDSGTLTTSRLILLVSCLPPLLIGVLFEPTYKMLSYGVILALFVLALPSFEKRTL